MKKETLVGMIIALAILVTGSGVLAHGWGNDSGNVERKVTQIKDGIRVEITSKDPTVIARLQKQSKFAEEYGFGPGMMSYGGMGCPMMRGW